MNVYISELGRGLEDVYHAAAFHNNLASVSVSGIDYLLYPVHVAGKSGNYDPRTLMLREDRIYRLADSFLRIGEAGPLGIRGIAHESQHTLFSKLREALEVYRIAEHRRVIHLEVTRMNDGADRRGYRKSTRIRY